MIEVAISDAELQNIQEQWTARAARVLKEAEDRAAELATDAVKAVWARQITDESEVAGDVTRVVCTGFGLFVVFRDGRWACYDCDCEDYTFHLCTEPSGASEMWRIGLLTQAECLEHKRKVEAYYVAKYAEAAQ